VLVELKNGETYNGHLVSCDSWMNINLRKVIHTSKDGDKFWQISETYIRGNTIKYLCIPDEVIDKVKEESSQPQRHEIQSKDSSSTRGRGRGGARGRGGPGRGGIVTPRGRGGRGRARGQRN